MNSEGIQATIWAMLTDDDGDLLVGIEHGITAEMVLKKMGITPYNCDPYLYQKKYNHVGVALNQTMARITRTGSVAGGMSRSPTYFFIARKGNRREEGLILYKKIKNTTGRMKAIRNTGRNFIDPKKIASTIKYLENLSNTLQESESQNDPMQLN